MLSVLALLAVPPAVMGQSTAPPTDKAAAPGASKSMDMGKDKSMNMGKATGMGAGEGDMRSTMLAGMKTMDSMKMTGDTDRDFATMMKVHHQGAIDMAQMELKSGKDAKMRGMAKRIIEAQQKEIKEIDRWLATRK